MLLTPDTTARDREPERVTDEWWRDAVIYQIYPRSFADSDGDGIGDLPGVVSRLDHIQALGADALWLSPFFVSPQADAGYDVADYCDVDPLFGTLADADRLIAETHARGMRIIIDLVPNHTSSAHPWFRAAVHAPAGSRERARYLFRDGRGPGGALPPNDWISVFGGPAWSRVADGQWYLHLFDAGQPDLDWGNPEVAAEFDGILRFWLDRGVDGFRVDVAHGLIKAEGLPSWPRPAGEIIDGGAAGPMWDQDGVHAIYRRWRSLLGAYGPERVLVAEAWVAPAERLSRYVRPDEMHQAFNFDFLTVGWSADRMRRSIESSLRENAAVGATTTWVLSNHDVMRAASRFGLPDALSWPPTPPADGSAVDPALGLRRARAAAMAMLALPGSAYVYAGEELGLPDNLRIPDDARQDPTFHRTGGAEPGRDGCRVPLPWVAAAAALGFSPTGASWLPQPPEYSPLSADLQAADPDSTLTLYRRCIALRRAHGLGAGRITCDESGGVLDIRNGGVRVLVNTSGRPHPLPAGRALVVSGPEAVVDGLLMPDAAVWLG